LKIIETKNLGRTYQKGKIQIPALQDINLTIEEGEFVSIVGKSGSGKSTLLNLIGGLDQATEGELLFAGTSIFSMNRHQLAQHRKYSVGMIFQSFNLIQSRNALENVELALTFGGVKRSHRKQIAAGLLEKVGLHGRFTHLPDELSGGETQRVAIARALANNPKVLLADEPTGNLDSQTSQEIMDVLVDLNQNQKITILMVTHDEETTKRVSDMIIKLKDGKITEVLQKKN
jgi:ABC-type lipoprotein export system ATPase subunit